MHPNHPARAGPTGGPLGGIISYPPPSVQSRRAEKTPHAFVKSAQAAAAHNLPLLAEMPIDPALASLTDAGDIESFQGDWLAPAADKLEGK